MGPKKVTERKKRMMSMELKHEIIDKHERGMRVVDLARLYERGTSTICSILKRKESIKAITPAKGVKIISKLRTSVHEKMETMLLMWLTEKQLAGDTMTKSIICEKARAIYDDLAQQQSSGISTVEGSEGSFKASRGWFDNFKKRTGIHSVSRHGDMAWEGVTRKTLPPEWKRQWPKVVFERDFDGFEPEGVVVDEIVSLGKSMGLVVNEGDVNELVEELTKEELNELQMQQNMKQEINTAEGPDVNEIVGEEHYEEEHYEEQTTDELQMQQHIKLEMGIAGQIEPEPAAEKGEEEEVISTSEIEEMLRMWKRLSEFIKKKHPEKVATVRVSMLFNDTCLSHFRDILKDRKKKTSSNKRPVSESEGIVTKKQKNNKKTTKKIKLSESAATKTSSN